MREASGTIARARELLFVSAAGIALAILMTWPLATDLAHLGRTLATNADGQFSIWNIAWVARTLAVDPLHLFDANIYFPHKLTLAYSEANIVPGLIGLPVYWLSRNPWLTTNVVMLFGFVSAYVGAYALMRYLTRDARAAGVAAILYAFCPYVFSHLSHIQLLMTGGMPLSLLALHRLADADQPIAAAVTRRSIWLGLALAAQALSCAYYGIFAALMVGYATLLFAITRRLWRSTHYWIGIAGAAALSIAIVLPFFIPYLRVQAESGFTRTVEDAVRWAARPHGYLVSPANAHRWLLDAVRQFGPWDEVLFPGFVAVILGAAGVLTALRGSGRDRESALLYGTLGILAFWASFGPSAGLYRVLFHLPAFSFLRAPSRLGLVVVLCLAIFSAFALRALFRLVSTPRRPLLAGLATTIAVADLLIFPLRWDRAPELPAPYKLLAASPRGPLAEFPFYGDRIAFPLHAQYMLFSTSHWMPMVNGYSDVIPLDFREAAPVLATFPSDDAFRVLARRRVRYLAIHWDMYDGRQDDVRDRLTKYLRFLRLLAQDERMSLYEVAYYP